jgi:hypothetical protein
LPDVVLKGRVTKVNRYAEPGSWFSSSVKEYATTIEIIDPPEIIRTGMTAAVEVFIQQLPDATQVPIQGLYEHGGNMYSLVQTGPQSFETRAVEAGAINDTMANIVSGLEPGEKVVLNLREHLNLLDLPEIVAVDNSEMRDLRETAPAEGAGEAAPGAGPPGGRKPGMGRPQGGPPKGNGGAAGGGANRPGANKQTATETSDEDVSDSAGEVDETKGEPAKAITKVTETIPAAS